MEIEITNRIIAEGCINLKMFKQVMQRRLNLEEAINHSLTLKIKRDGITLKNILALLRFQIDWGDILVEMNNQPKKELMNFKIVMMVNVDRNVYDLGFTDTKTFKFNEVKAYQVEAMVIQDLIPNPNYNMAINLSRTTFAFRNEKWKQLQELNK